MTATQYRYTGQLAQDSVGLDYYVARWYDPVIGHFTSADTIIPNQYDPKDSDRYSYVNYNPILRNDPTGHCAILCTAVIGAGVGAVVGGVGYGVYTAASGNQFEWGTFFLAVGGGAVAGALIGTGVGIAAGLTQAAATSAAITAAGAAETANVACGNDLCTSEAQDVTNLAQKAIPAVQSETQVIGSNAFGTLSKAMQYGIDTYSKLRDKVAGSGLEVHHIVEQRFSQALGTSKAYLNQFTVALTRAEHRVFTNGWREAISYGEGTAKATAETILTTAEKVYKDYPALLDKVRNVLAGLGE